jgi:hypothetical protein
MQNEQTAISVRVDTVLQAGSILVTVIDHPAQQVDAGTQFQFAQTTNIY